MTRTRAHTRSLLALLPLAVTLAACSSLSGVGGSDKLACPLPDGASCTPLHDVYANTRTATSPPPSRSAEAPVGIGTDQPTRPRLVGATSIQRPLRSSARLLRAWFAPWTDSDADLVGDMRIYLKLDDGEWQLDHVRAGVRQGFAPLRPPPPQTAASASATQPAGSAPPRPMAAARSRGMDEGEGGDE